MIMTSPLFKEDTIQHCNIHRLAFWRHVNGSRADGLCGNKSGGYSRWQVAPQEVGPPSYPLGAEPSISKGGQDLQNDGRIIRWFFFNPATVQRRSCGPDGLATVYCYGQPSNHFFLSFACTLVIATQ
uniref:Uncharacterized protein n=1 Tax=Caenorhabditis japonica TaxID=281687 RepID=A0A8R1E696_CAEJA